MTSFERATVYGLPSSGKRHYSASVQKAFDAKFQSDPNQLENLKKNTSSERWLELNPDTLRQTFMVMNEGVSSYFSKHKIEDKLKCDILRYISYLNKKGYNTKW